MRHNIRYDDLEAARRRHRFEEAQASPFWGIVALGGSMALCVACWAWVVRLFY